MKKVRITVMKVACYPDLMAQYENPMEHPCDMTLGQVFVADGWTRPEGLCLSAWESMYVSVCVGAGQRRGESLCRVDEKSALGHDLLQRRLPAREFFIGNARRLTALLY